MNRLSIISFLALSSAPALTGEKPGVPAIERAARPRTITLHHADLTLRVDPTRIALLGGPQPAAAATGLEARAPIGPRGWSIATARAQTGQSVRAVVAELAGGEAFDFVAPVLLGQRDLVLIPTGELLVMLQPGVAREAAEALLEQTGGGVILERAFGGLPGAYRLRLNTRDGFAAIDAANALAALPQVKFAEPDMICQVEPDYTPNDPLFPEQWGLHNTGQEGGLPDMDMDVPEAWDTTLGDPSVLVAVLDDGVELDHPDLNVWYGADFTDDGPGGSGGPVNPCDSHGTAVAGCVGATIDNGLGLAGAAPGCAIASARYVRSNINDPCDNSGWVLWSGWIEALEWARQLGARVTVNSNSFGGWSAAVEEKMQQTRYLGMIHFGSAGNNAAGAVNWPASSGHVRSVAALDRDGTRAWFSNYGPGLDFIAPGVEIQTTDVSGAGGYLSGDYGAANGTSFAAPNAAAVAALVLSTRPDLHSSDVEVIMWLSAQDVGPPGYEEGYGWGLVNARAALDMAAGWAVDNDYCVNAEVIDAGDFPFSTAGTSTDGPGLPGGCDAQGATLLWNDEWFVIYPPDGRVVVEVCDAGFDVMLAAYHGDCYDFENVACGQPAPCGGARLEFDALGASTYHIRVGGRDGASGSGTLAIRYGDEPPGGPGFQSLAPMYTARGVSADGGTVVGCAPAPTPGFAHAVRWTAEDGVVAIPGLLTEPGATSCSWAASADGSVVVGAQTYGGQEAFRWSELDGLQFLGPGRAHKVSDDGTTVIGIGDGDYFLWTPTSGTQSLGSQITPADLAPDGALILGSDLVSTYLWTETTGWMPIGDPPPPPDMYSGALAMSADGGVIAGFYGVIGGGDTFEAWRWTAGGGTETIGAFRAFDAAADGATIVGDMGGFTPTRAAIWTRRDGLRDLNEVVTAFAPQAADWELLNAEAVSADGRVIVGNARNLVSGGGSAYRVTLPQPPFQPPSAGFEVAGTTAVGPMRPR